MTAHEAIQDLVKALDTGPWMPRPEALTDAQAREVLAVGIANAGSADAFFTQAKAALKVDEARGDEKWASWRRAWLQRLTREHGL